MQAIITPHRHLKLFIAIAIAILGVVTAIVMMRPAHAQGPQTGQHIITVHDDGIDKGFVTEATTVRAALQDGGIRLDARDRTEPGLDEKLVANSYQVNIYRARPVLIRDGSKEMTIITSYRTGKQITADAKITLQSEDTVVLGASTDPIADGAAEVMTIMRATPFTFVFYGKTEQAFTQAKTVGGMLKEKGIKMTKDDEVQSGVSTPISAGMTVKLWRNGIQTVTQEEDVTFETEQVKDSDHEVGYKEIQTVGENGRRTVTYRIEVQNGIEVSRSEVNSIVLKPAVKQVEIIGTKVNLPTGSHEDWMAAAGIAESDFGYVNYIVGSESGWSPTKYNYAGSGAYGLCQSLPASKMATMGADYMTNPITQLKWCNSYAVGRYGSWEGAYNFWLSKHWW